jgi:hypothetical protein
MHNEYHILLHNQVGGRLGMQALCAGFWEAVTRGLWFVC